MQRQFTSGSRQAPDPCDQFLEENNFYRKHTARDASCLFRVVSEQIYDSQLHHLDIRKKCVEYMRKYSLFFQSLVDQNLSEYLDELSKPKTFGTLIELQAIGYMYKCNVILFQPFDLGSCFIDDKNFKKVIRVFYSQERHFDSVFTCDYIKDAAICQGICYEILYKDIFKLPDVAFAVEQMLYSTLENVEYVDNKLICVNGQVFDLDSPENTNCILENSAMCRFHSSKSSEGSSDESDVEVEWMLPGKNISCVRQLLMEGITPFPYKVAKALDPDMYRNIEFDAWNEARKELKFQNWYSGDTNFKVGAKCHVKLHKADEDVVYTCHIQEIDGITGQCNVFIEELGEKRTVPYESLSPLPIDQFKPWTLPYRVQRQLNKFNSLPFAVRNYNYRLKFDEHYTSNYKYHTNQKQYAAVALSASSMTTHQNDYFCNMKQYTHLENFRAQTIEYCTMPITVSHDLDINGNIEAIESAATQPPHSSAIDKESDQNTEMNDKNKSSTDVLVADGQQITNEMESESTSYAPHVPYYYQVPSDECFGYNNMQPATFVPTNNGGTVYYYNHSVPSYTPIANNIYMQPPPPYQQHPLVATSASSPQNFFIPPNHPYPNSTPLVTSPRPIISHCHNPPLFREQSNSTVSNFGNGQINLDAKKSVKGNGSDLPADVATLKYFYNLGVDYYQRYMRQNRAVDNKENVSKKNTDGAQCNETREVKLDSNNNNITAHPPPNPRNSQHINAIDAYLPNHKNNNRRYGMRHTNNRDRSMQRNVNSNSNFKGHPKSQQRNEVDRNHSNKNVLSRNYPEQFNCNSYSMQHQNHLEMSNVNANAGGNEGANTAVPQGVPSAVINCDNSNVENPVQNTGNPNHGVMCNDFEHHGADPNMAPVGNAVPGAPSTMYIQVGPAPQQTYNPYGRPGMIHSANGFPHPGFLPPLVPNPSFGNENVPGYNDNVLQPWYNVQPSYPQAVPYYYAPAQTTGMPQMAGFNGMNNIAIQSNIAQPSPSQYQ